MEVSSKDCIKHAGLPCGLVELTDGRDAADRARQSVCAITAAFSAAEKYARAALRALEGWMALATRGRLDARRGEAAVAAFGGPRPRGSLAHGGHSAGPW